LVARVVDVGGILRQALAGQHQQAQQQGRLEVIPETHRPRGAGGDLDRQQQEQALGIDQARRLTAQLRARLAGLLQSRRLQPSYPRRSGQRLDREGLHRLAAPTPDARLFRCRSEKIDSDTAVLILGDRSGSMSGPRMQTAIRSAYVTAAALELLPGVACAVGFFPFAEKVALVKDFGEKVQPGRFALQASGSTPMAEALLWAAMQLTHRKEKRKLVMVLTDGQPDDGEATCAVMKRLQACGIETFGIGIQDRSILSWMNKGARVIHECGELPQALVELLREALLGKTAVGR
jgi:Mg-chelatase subunit ChlD